eukprot:3933939-Rhodomonas_salina.3
MVLPGDDAVTLRSVRPRVGDKVGCYAKLLRARWLGPRLVLTRNSSVPGRTAGRHGPGGSECVLQRRVARGDG